MNDIKIYRLLAPNTARSQISSALIEIYKDESIEYGTKYFNFPEKKSIGILMEVIKSIWNDVQIGRITEQEFNLDELVQERRKKQFIYHGNLRKQKQQRDAAKRRTSTNNDQTSR